MTIVGQVLGLAAILYLALAGGMFVFQRQLLYKPDTQRVSPQDAGLEQTVEVTTTTADGLTLSGWWMAAADDRPVVLYFQGNGGNIAGRAGKAEIMRTNGYSVLLAGYRGYGGNPGGPSEVGLIADARAWHAWLIARGVRAGTIVLYGESLGSGVATALAVERDIGALVLEAPYTSIRALAQAKYPFLPVRWLLRDPFDSLARIPQVRVPVLVLHGDADTLIPLHHGEAMFAAANDPKRLEVIAGATHTTLVDLGAFRQVDAFLVDHGIALQYR